MLPAIQNLVVIRQSDGTYSATWTGEVGADDYSLMRNGVAIGKVTSPSATGLVLSPNDVFTVTAESFSPADPFTVPVPPPPLKVMAGGLLDRKTMPTGFWSWLLDYVCSNTNQEGAIDWNQMQPVSFGPLVHPNPLDTALPGKYGIKFRSGKSCGAPVDLKKPGITVTGSQGQTGVAGEYWSSHWFEAYQDYQTKCAAEYDGAPNLHGVTMAMASLDYEEPFIRYSWAALAAAGLTLDLDQAALQAMIDIHCTTWKQTPQELALNPYNAPGGNPLLYQQLAGAARQKYGKIVVLGNNSIRDPLSSLGALYAAMYAWIKAQGGPIYFQTATAARVGSLYNTLMSCLGFGACAIELPTGYQTNPTLTLVQAQTVQKALLANLAKAA